MTSGWWSISEMAKHHQTTPRALRFYEQRGILAPSRIGDRRLYSGNDRVKLKLIAKGKRLGLTLGEIKKLIDKMVAEKRLDENTKPSDLTKSMKRIEIEQRIDYLSRKRDTVQSAICALRTALSR